MPRKRPGRLSGPEDDSQDEILADDSDVLTNLNSNLTLKIGIGDIDEPCISMPSSPSCVSIESNRDGVGYVNFEVISTDTVKEGRSSFVVYKLLLSGHGIEKTPGIVEKRYTDFEKFNSKLRKRFPELMENVSFPKKVLMGNLKNETIAKRSRAFEQYLNQLMAVDEIRFSNETKKFFYEKELHFATDLLTAKNYEEAVGLFEKCLPIQEKIMGSMNSEVIKTLCAIIASYQGIENQEKALKYSNTALLCIGERIKDPFYLPLLHNAIYLHWMLGKEKTHLESKLGELGDKGISTETYTNFLETVIRELKR